MYDMQVATHPSQPINYMPRNLEELEKISEKIANSGICPQALKGRPADVMMILMTGSELGLKPGQALRTLGSFNGVPFAYGDGLTALVQRHPDYEYMAERVEGSIEDGSAVAYCTMKRRGSEPVTNSYSMLEARRAGLFSKAGPWQQHPKRMLARRARSYTAKDVFADALFGLITEDEAINMTVVEAAPIPQTKGLSGLKETLGLNEPTVMDIVYGVNCKDTDGVETTKETLC